MNFEPPSDPILNLATSPATSGLQDDLSRRPNKQQTHPDPHPHPHPHKHTKGTMPCTIIRNSTQPPTTGPSTAKAPSAHFTGDVYMDKMGGPRDGLMCNHVTFLPGARTFWHRHEHGQVLEVKAGGGWVCDRGGRPQRIRVGDIVTCPAGTTHWHGADDGSMLVHLAVSLGETTWLEEVGEEEYRGKASG